MKVRALVLLSLSLTAWPALAADPGREMYVSAAGGEKSVRAVLADAGASAERVADLRKVINAYVAVVRRFPTSAYADDALWHGGRLALEAYDTFKEQADRTLALRLLSQLSTSYPASRWAKAAAEQAAALKRAVDPAARPAVGAKDAVKAPAASAKVPAPAAAAAVTAPMAPEPDAGADRLVTIREVRRALLPDMVRVIVELDGATPFRHERLTGPERVFVDFTASKAAQALGDRTLRFEGDGDLVRHVRIGRHPNNVTRVVVDAVGAANCAVYSLADPARVVVDCLRAASGAAVLPSKPIGTPWLPHLPGVRPARTKMIAEAVKDMPPIAAAVVRRDVAPASLPLASPVTAVAANSLRQPLASAAAGSPARNSNGGFSMARQLGLGVSRLVIDPGHGGHDPGASGKGVTEAELVLDVALRLEKLLLKTAGTEVILTRRDDRFIPLQERTAMANREGADLFLSIHANASDNGRARGVETYFLNFARSRKAAAVAARENAASGHSMGALTDLVKSITLNNKLDESRDLAAHVQHAMVERLRGPNKGLKNLGVKQAPFVVLIGASMPSVLAEISFVTNPQDARLLRSGAYRQHIAEALYSAVRKYQSSLKRSVPRLPGHQGTN